MHHTLIVKCIQPQGWSMVERRLFKNILCNVARAGYLSRHVEQEASPFGLIVGEAKLQLMIEQRG